MSRLFHMQTNINFLRLAFSFAAPILVGAFLFLAWNLFYNPSEEGLVEILITLPGMYLVSVFFGFVLMGIQSLFYACLMEWLIIPRVGRSYMLVLFSFSLGTLAGLTLWLLMELVQFLFIGAASGAIVGIALMKMFRTSI